jgi:mono/diheme cytochrome c family protein
VLPRIGAMFPLHGVSRKWAHAASLARFLADPSRTHPYSRMPSLLLTEPEAASLATYLIEADQSGGAAVPPETGRELGRAVAEQRRCGACHALPGVATPPLPPPRGADPAVVRRGCLAETAQTGVPLFPLAPAERQDLRAYVLAGSPPPRSDSPAKSTLRALDRLHCTQCHERDGVGGEFVARADAAAAGVERALLQRLAPPPLGGIAARLATSWLRGVFLEQRRARPWSDVRMPHFDPRMTATLAAGLASLEGESLDPAGAGPDDRALAAEGGRLAGEDGLRCTACHALGGAPAEVTGPASLGPDFDLIPERIRGLPWFERWLRDPQSIEPGTAMPSYFPRVGDAPGIHALWAFLRR